VEPLRYTLAPFRSGAPGRRLHTRTGGIMPEILTESFCERCGTRYTFETVAPRKTKKLGQFKTLSKGVKNWVMSDDSSLDEAMAAARSDEEREQTAQQLDAFHSTFNFCMNCRQYTCSNCWNGAEGRCLSCAPNLGQEVLGTPFPSAVGDPVRLDAEAWPETDIGAGDGVPDLETLLAGGNGLHRHQPNGVGIETTGTGPASNGAVEEDADFDPFARLAFLTGEAAAPAWPAEEIGADPSAIDGSTDLVGLPTPVEADAAEAVSPVEELPAAAVDAGPAAVAEPVAEAPAAPTPSVAAGPAAAAPPLPDEVEDRAAALSVRTADLLGRFRPGQNIDAELAAYEAELDAKERATDVVPEIVEAAAAAVAVDALTDAEPLAAATPVAEPPVAETPVAVTEPEGDAAGIAAAALAAAAAAEAARAAEHPAAAEHEAEPAAEPEAAPEPEPVLAEPEPVAAQAEPAPPESEPAAPEPPVRQDRVEQPTWRIYAPDGADTGTPSVVPGGPSPQPSIPAQANGAPQWPSRPDLEESPSMALLANRARAGDDALWAASTREVLGPPGGTAAAPTAGVQPCSSCGLSLSANARFCRRCGTRQS
jgi:hypothetical protein